MSKRVAVTGLGIYSSAGKDLSSFIEAILTARRCFKIIPHKELRGFGENVAALVEAYPEPVCLKNIPSEKLDPVTKLAAEAAEQALVSAGLRNEPFGNETALVVSTCSGPMISIEKFYEEKSDKGALPPLSYNSIANTLSEVFGLSGFTTTITTACSAGSAAVGFATDLIREKRAKRVIVVGSDTFSPTTFAGFFGLKAVSSESTTPFSEKNGMTLGEAGAAVILEDLEIAEKRNASIICEVAGFGLSNDAFHCSAPDNSGKGQSYAMTRAIKHSGISADDISFINAHGTGTAANDRAETKAVRRVFQDKSDNISMSSTKSMIGHCLGAAGLVEMIATICCAKEDVLPATAGFSAPREGCDIDPVPEINTPWSEKGPFMNNNFAFGGNNASLILSRSGKLKECKVEDSFKHNIVITGVGVINAAGIGTEAFNDKAALKSFTVEDFNEREIDRRLDLKGMDRSSRFATVAAKLALSQSGFKERPSNLRELGLILGLSTGTTSAEEVHVGPLMKNGFTIDKVQNFPFVVPNSIQGNVCRALHLQGHNTVITSGKDSSHEVIGLAVSAINSGHTDKILCGAVNEIFNSDPNHISDQGEGAVVFMVETEESVKTRGASPVGSIIDSDFFFSNEANLEKILTEKIEIILKNNNLSAENIQCISKTDPLNKIADVLIEAGIINVDLHEKFGDTESCSSLMNIAYILSADPFDIKGDKNYILSLSCDENGANSILLIKTI